MTRLRIDKVQFDLAFDRDVDYHDSYAQEAYLDCESGDIFWVYESDDDAVLDGWSAEENQAMRHAVKTEPERYLEITGRSHGEHHDILQEFLDSDWTEDSDRRAFARGAYRSSIGWWIEAMEEAGEYEIVQEYYNFRGRALEEEKVHFLRQRDIEPRWD